MPTFHNPSDIAAPIGAYSHGVLAKAGAATLQVSGQVGIALDGTVPEDAAAQSAIVWTNLKAILRDAGMGVEHITKMTAYLTDPADLAAYGAARSAVLGDHRPASTLLYVSALVKPELKVEVDIVAAKE